MREALLAITALATFETQGDHLMTFALHTIFAQLSTMKEVEAETLYDFDSMMLNIAIFFVIMLVLLAFAAVVLASGKFKAQLQAQLSANNSTNTDSHTA